MGLTSNCSKFLFYCKTKGVDFSRTLTLGRMTLYATRNDIAEQIKLFRNNAKAVDDVQFKDEFSEPLFEILGAQTIDSMDFSDYEKATIIHDLNKPVADTLKNKFTAIIDGGTVEHVFNFPVAIKSCMEMLKVGGHYIAITPANNTMGHGFYQFTPELYFNVFSAANGFAVKKMIIFTESPVGTFSDWYEVVNPAEVKNRVLLINSKPTYLLLLAEKKEEKQVFRETPQQSDYQSLWAVQKSLQEHKIPQQGKLKYMYRRFVPKFARIFLRNTYDLFTKEKITDEALGTIDATHYKKMNIEKELSA